MSLFLPSPKLASTLSQFLSLAGAVAVAVAMVTAASPANAAKLKAMDENGKLTGAFAVLEGHLSLFSDQAESSMLAGSWGYAGRGGYRWKNWGVCLQVEQNLWLATEYDTNVVQGAVNIAVGGEFIYAGGLMRTALFFGPSILAYDTPLDEAGSVGIYFGVRPAGFRWAPHKLLVIGFDPLSLNFVAPVLDEIPLIYIQYRTSLYLEVAF